MSQKRRRKLRMASKDSEAILDIVGCRSIALQIVGVPHLCDLDAETATCMTNPGDPLGFSCGV